MEHEHCSAASHFLKLAGDERAAVVWTGRNTQNGTLQLGLV